MVGKIKHVRQKLHQEAVKLDGPSSSKQTVLETHKVHVLPVEKKKEDPLKSAEQVHNSFPTGIFAGTKITPEALVQTLKLEQPPDVPVPAKKEPEEKKVKSKKEKMKERRERWLNKISFIKQFQEQQAATARRQATPVVGDLRPLADALPELCQLRPLPTPTLLYDAKKQEKQSASEEDRTHRLQPNEAVTETQTLRNGDEPFQ
ncbi:ribosome biogenesis protein SLX9 homolog isoform X1 [Sphaeramia orbicularis]|uniref:ribosome biogenesis protein SLX9 homolog isoform X1 n=1 Tax=Sphaeramia orbicularis TaxID=375764 RepID=UPI00117D1672|nr:protein FAM207A isoform X1 [Sphaeramia orbicularis]